MNTPNYEPNSAAYLAGVWYVMRDARESYEKAIPLLMDGRQSKWGYLNKIRQALHLEQQPGISYERMRQELIDFAEQFGKGLEP